MGWALQIVLIYIVIALGAPRLGNIGKHALIILLILIMFSIIWGMCIYEDEKELWGGKIYVITVTCIGHSEFRNRYRRSCYLDVADGRGTCWNDIEVPGIIMEAVENQENMLAVTNDPGGSTPIRLVPLHPPVKQHF